MDDQIVDLMRDQFKLIHDKIDMTQKTVNDNIDEMKGSLVIHVDEDRRYWKAIDEQRGQLNLMKWLFPSGGVLIAWLWSKFGGH
jgi:hypothetical protein